MTRTLTAVFDGTSLKPTEPLDLEQDKTYQITIELPGAQAADGDAWEVLASLAGTVEAPADWALEHDHYLYGTPKRGS